MHNVPENPLQAMLTSPWRVAIFAVVVVLAGGVREEVQRGFILHRFDNDLGGAHLGLLLFSVAFGLGHLTQGLDAALITGALGLLWGVMYLHRRSVVAPGDLALAVQPDRDRAVSVRLEARAAAAHVSLSRTFDVSTLPHLRPPGYGGTTSALGVKRY